MDVEQFNKRVASIIKASDEIEMKDPKDLTYAERHAIRHMRRLRDEEYAKIAYRSCDEYCKEYTQCHDRERYLAAFKCRDALENMKVCVNRQIIRLRESAPDITTVPLNPIDAVNYDDPKSFSEYKKRMGLDKQ